MIRLAALLSISLLVPASQTRARPGNDCGWSPPVTKRTVSVRRADELVRAAASVGPGTTILLEDGTYQLNQMVDLPVAGTVLRSRSGQPDKVVIRGRGMTDTQVGVAISIGAPDVTVADLTAGDVGYHAIQVRGERGAMRAVIHGVRLVDSGQQLLKGSVGTDGPYADDGLVACSRFEYTTNAPSDYTNGVDLLAAKGWVIRDNVFRRIRGPERMGWRAGPAILAWANSQDTIIERNLIVESFRGIALGLAPGITPYVRNGERRIDHQGGVVRNNVVCNPHPWADEAIEANAAVGFRIEHNTVLTFGAVTPWAIGVRFPTARGVVRNNLTSRPILRRDGGDAELSANLTSAVSAWFADASACDLHLAPAGTAAVDSGVEIPDAPLDFDGKPRVGRPDVGAFEYHGGIGQADRGGRR
jgi:hypothetical protein